MFEPSSHNQPSTLDKSSLSSAKNISTTTNSPVELLLPAGNLEKLSYAFAYGADAVYLGLPLFSLRARENDFTLEKLKQAVEIAHSQNKKIYFTLNVFARNTKIKPFENQLTDLVSLGVDAFIMSDPGLISIVKEKHPEQEVHLSVQANCMSWKTAEFWHKQGISRIVLSRELRIAEVETIKDKVPTLELEAFIHGSICIAYSGRCLMSHYMSRRDANQGVCDNSCRYPMKLYMKDERNPDTLYSMDEDEHGTYIMNAKDLCLLPHLKKLRDAGICSFKVEGRTKSIYYLAMVTRLYRQALEDLYEGKPFDPSLMTEAYAIPNRGYHSGFMIQKPDASFQDYTASADRAKNSLFVGLVRDTVDAVCSESELEIKPSAITHSKGPHSFCTHIEVRNRLRVGDKIEIVSPSEEPSFILPVKELVNSSGESVDIAHGGTGVFAVPTPQAFSQFSIVKKVQPTDGAVAQMARSDEFMTIK